MENSMPMVMHIKQTIDSRLSLIVGLAGFTEPAMASPPNSRDRRSFTSVYSVMASVGPEQG